jgi:hypothetical protein
MEHVFVERVFAEPVDVEALIEASRAGATCFERHRVSGLRTVVSRDGLRMICEYLAPDAESVRSANESAGLPFERVWTGQVLGPSPSPSEAR